MSEEVLISCIIPASTKDAESQNLKDLIVSIKSQDFPQDKIEILVITEGDSEQAKAIGIRRAKGKICAMFCADNIIIDDQLFKQVYDNIFKLNVSGVYTRFYAVFSDDNSLNRYFSLIGGNDPVCYYLGKNDREPHVKELIRSTKYPPSFGCNGFFYRSELIKATDLNHYYPMDNAREVGGVFTGIPSQAIWHRTSDNLFTFLKKRYRYARDLYCERLDRRWKIIDTQQDKFRLLLFVLSTVTVIPCLVISIKGFIKIRDIAWFYHFPVCLGFLITYGFLAARNLFKFGNLFQRRY